MITVGAKAERRVVVDDRRTISFMGPEIRVYATPAMIEDIEMACRDLLLEMIEPDHDSVGTRVDVSHLGSLTLGGLADLQVVIVSVAGRRVTFDANVRANGTLIGSGFHERAVVSIPRLKARLGEGKPEAR
jgi:fluoroacetyl-CoA thioesterase